MTFRIRRREFIATLGGAVAAWPLAARAQQPAARIYRIGYLAPSKIPHLIEALQEGLRAFGYEEGRNVQFDYRFAEGQADTLDALASELVRLRPDVIVAVSTPAVLAAKRATTAIPVVMAAAGDPLRSGIAASLARPDGNITGVSLYSSELSRKRLEVLKEAIPRIARVAVLGNAGNPINESYWQETQTAGLLLGIESRRFDVKALDDLSGAFAGMKGERADSLIVLSDAAFYAARRQIIGLAADYRLPAMYEGREFVDAGGLMSYGSNIANMTRRSAAFVDKTLKGAKPADLPIEQPTTFELVINLKTAKALGLTVPPMLLARADEVIE
jgi:putative ABC transport system substrate-binding protein